AIDDYAMRRAQDHFTRTGYVVQNVSSHSSYDLLCTGRSRLFVEVKGTTTRGEDVLLTPKEVAFARSHRARMGLCVVHSIRLANGARGPRLSGGRIRVLPPCDIEAGTLSPLGYTFTLPVVGGVR